MQYSLSRLNPATLDVLRGSLGESKNVDIFLRKLGKFLSGDGSSVAEQDLCFSTASELSAANIFDLIPAHQLSRVIEAGERSKAEAFKIGLAQRYRSALEKQDQEMQVSRVSKKRYRVPLAGGARRVAGTMTLEVPAGLANPSPPIGPALGQRGINIMEFCKAFNAKTQELEPGAPVPAVVTYYSDKTFTMEIKTPPASYFIKKAAKLKSGSRSQGRSVAGSITTKQVREIAEAKMNDLNAGDLKAAMKIIIGSAQSMGINVKD